MTANELGAVSEILAVTPTRVLLRGWEAPERGCSLPLLTLLDVSDVTQPKILQRPTIGRELLPGWSNAWLLGEGPVQRLVLSFRGRPVPGPTEKNTPVGLELYDVEFAAGTLTSRGRVWLAGPFSGRIVANGTQLLAISDKDLRTIDVPASAPPVASAPLPLAPSVQEVKFPGGHALTVVHDLPTEWFSLQLNGKTLSSVEPSLATVDYTGRFGKLFTRDRMVFLFWSAWNGGRGDTRLDILEVVGNQMVRRSSRSLTTAGADVDFGFSNDGEGSSGTGVRMVGDTTFVLPVRRAQECPMAGSTQPGMSPPGDGALCDPAFPTAPMSADRTPAPAAAIDEAATVQQLRAAAPCPGAAADLLVLDARDAGRPIISAALRLPNSAYLFSSVVDGNQIFINQIEEPKPDAHAQLIRYFTTAIDLANLHHPLVEPTVNVPGPLLAQRRSDQMWFVAEPLPNTAGVLSGLAVTPLHHAPGSDRTDLRQQLRFTGDVSMPVVDGSTVYATVNANLVAVDLAGAAAPQIVSQTPVPGAAIATAQQTVGGLPTGHVNPNGAGPSKGRPASLHRIVGQHAFVLLGGSEMAVFDVRNPAQPRHLEQAVKSPRGAMPVRLAPDNRAVVPNGEWGVEIVPFGAAPTKP
jgi:hypothetical protein